MNIRELLKLFYRVGEEIDVVARSFEIGNEIYEHRAVFRRACAGVQPCDMFVDKIFPFFIHFVFDFVERREAVFISRFENRGGNFVHFA